MKTLSEWIKEYRSGVNPITGEPNLFKDLSDQMVWDAAQEELRKSLSSDAVLGEVPNDIEDILYKGLALCQLAEDSVDKVIISKYIILNFASQVAKIIDKYGLNK